MQWLKLYPFWPKNKVSSYPLSVSEKVWHVSSFFQLLTLTYPPQNPALNAGLHAAASSPSGQPSAIKSFVRRAGRITRGQARALADLGSQFLLPFQSEALDLIAVYADRTGVPTQMGPQNAYGLTAASPLVLEIGFGMGEATAHIAAMMPHTRFLCCDVHQPGIGALLQRIDSLNLKNVRICAHDAVMVVDQMLPPACLDGVHIFFPDPWHKKKHHKRRLIQPPFIARLSTHLRVGGYIHCATDHQPYALQMLDVLSAEPLLKNQAAQSRPDLLGYAPRPSYRPQTKFEQRGIRLGRGVWDLVFERVAQRQD